MSKPVGLPTFSISSMIMIFALVTTFASAQERFSPTINLQISDEIKVVVSLHGEQVVKAGEILPVILTIDPAPNYEGSNLQVEIRGPSGEGFVYGIALKPGKNMYEFPFQVPVAAAGGTWTIARLTFNSGGGRDGINISFKPYSFKVIPNNNLVFPTKADVGVNPSQVQLLRTASVGLQTRIRELKAQLYGVTSTKKQEDILLAALQEAVQALGETAGRFRTLSTNKSQSESAEIFFDDLRATYAEASTVLRASAAAGHAQFRTVGLQQDKADVNRNSAAYMGVLRALEQNEVAYTIVAEAQSLTFDLEIESMPPEALVLYHRKGDAFKKNPQDTNCLIRSLTYAIWFIRVEKLGHTPQEREHDPFREPNHKMTFNLKNE
jgi:hypothetical protein